MDFSKKINQILTLCVLGIIWGSSFILMKKALTTYSPIEITLYRIFIVFLVFFPLGIKSFFKIKKKTSFVLLLSAIIGSVIPYFLFIKAQTKIDSSLNGILNSITPLFTLLFGVIIFKQKTNFRAVIGVLVGLIGATSLIFLSTGGNIFSSSILYALLPVIGSACYALNINIIKTYLQDIPALKITSWSFIFIGPIAGFLLFFQTGFSVKYFSKFYANEYNPAISSFHIQNDRKIGEFPLIDFFANAKIKQTRVFLKVEHFNSTLTGNSFYSSPSYPYRDFIVRFGLVWNFFN